MLVRDRGSINIGSLTASLGWRSSIGQSLNRDERIVVHARSAAKKESGFAGRTGREGDIRKALI
jgi:hypothetical protein